MPGPHVQFCKRREGASLRAYSTDIATAVAKSRTALVCKPIDCDIASQRFVSVESRLVASAEVAEDLAIVLLRLTRAGPVYASDLACNFSRDRFLVLDVRRSGAARPCLGKNSTPK